jgi:hypothetical protein
MNTPQTPETRPGQSTRVLGVWLRELRVDAVAYLANVLHDPAADTVDRLEAARVLLETTARREGGEQ